VQRRPLPGVPLGEFGLEADAGVGVGEGVGAVVLGEVGGGAVGVVDVVGPVEVDGGGVVLDGLGGVFGLEGGVAFCFELFGGCHGFNACK